mgnify:CR=1 FL=1
MLAVNVTVFAVYLLFLRILFYFAWDIYGTGPIFFIILITFTLIWFVLALGAHLSLISRRLHDFDYSAKWIILFIGLIVLLLVLSRSFLVTLSGWTLITLILMFIPSTKGENSFGIGNIKNIVNMFE